jgi:hypothetical protein
MPNTFLSTRREQKPSATIVPSKTFPVLNPNCRVPAEILDPSWDWSKSLVALASKQLI